MALIRLEPKRSRTYVREGVRYHERWWTAGPETTAAELPARGTALSGVTNAYLDSVQLMGLSEVGQQQVLLTYAERTSGSW